MFKKADRKEARERRHLRVRKKAFGTPETYITEELRL